MSAARVPAVEGWFTMDDADPRLLGNRCTSCGTVFFPKASIACRNPSCAGTEFEDVPLSNRGRVWSYTTNHYAPPAPYMSPDPFEPYSVAAVELAEEKLVVLGQVVGLIDELPTVDEL
ncbi:MAG: OB-fold domain-containing protein, partial [Acidimicrobiia bacterium]|nr:OB-fold domain-containing protein [Acidimicrobiia bacterium]